MLGINESGSDDTSNLFRAAFHVKQRQKLGLQPLEGLSGSRAQDFAWLFDAGLFCPCPTDASPLALAIVTGRVIELGICVRVCGKVKWKCLRRHAMEATEGGNARTYTSSFSLKHVDLRLQSLNFLGLQLDELRQLALLLSISLRDAPVCRRKRSSSHDGGTTKSYTVVHPPSASVVQTSLLFSSFSSSD